MINMIMKKDAALLYIKREIIDKKMILKDIIMNENGTVYLCYDKDKNEQDLDYYTKNIKEEFYIFNINGDVILDIKENILDKNFTITDLDITKMFVLVSYVEQ